MDSFISLLISYLKKSENRLSECLSLGGCWAEDSEGKPVDVHSPIAVNYSLTGSIIKACHDLDISERLGFLTVEKLLGMRVIFYSCWKFRSYDDLMIRLGVDEADLL